MSHFEIAGRLVGPGAPVFTIAEIGLNHGGSVDRALALVDAAAAAGASAVKLQSLQAHRLVAEGGPAPAHLAGRTLRQVFGALELDHDAHRALAERARARGLAFMSTAFDEEMVDLLETVGCDAYKIASGDLTHHTLIERAAAAGKPLVISTGLGSLQEVGATVEVALTAGATALALLHCVSAYPVPLDEQNLAAIATLARTFAVPVGLSDHAQDPNAPIVAVTLGASLYERHLIRHAEDDAIDAAVSVTPERFAAIVRTMEDVRRALGHGRREPGPTERANRSASRRSLYAARDLDPGDIVTREDIRALRPAVGLDAHRWRSLVGAKVRRSLKAGMVFLDSDCRTAHHGTGGSPDNA